MTSVQVDAVRVAPAQVEGMSVDVLCALGAPADIAQEVSSHLVGANLAGHDSHGVQRLVEYASQVRVGSLDPRARPEVIDGRQAAILVDAHRGFGHFSTRFACEEAAERAIRFGVGAAAIRHSGHIGRVGHYSELLAVRGLVSVITVGMAGEGVGCTVIPGSSLRFLGANPWAIGIPAGHRPNVVVDISSAVAAEGKIQVARASGRQLPEGMIVDRLGQPSTDPSAYFDGGGLLPLGGTEAGHKGYGLGLASALLGGLATIGDNEPTLAGAGVAAGSDPRGRVAGVFVTVIDVAAFGTVANFRAQVDDTSDAIHRTSAGAVVPGEPESSTRSERKHEISIPSSTWRQLGELAAELDVSWTVG